MQDFQTFPFKQWSLVRAKNTLVFRGNVSFEEISQRLLQVNEFLPRTHRAGATWLKGVRYPAKLGGTSRNYPRIWYLEDSKLILDYILEYFLKIIYFPKTHCISESHCVFFLNVIKLTREVPLS